MSQPIGMMTEVKRYVERLKAGLASEKPCSVTSPNAETVIVSVGNQSQAFVLNEGLDGEARLNIARWFVSADAEPFSDVKSSQA
jgi:hypothetical protein